MASAEALTAIHLMTDVGLTVRQIQEQLALHHTLRRKHDPMPPAQQQLLVVLPLVLLTLDKASQRVAEGEAEPNVCRQLVTAARACQDAATSLLHILHNLRSNGTRVRLRSFFQQFGNRKGGAPARADDRLAQATDRLMDCDVQIAQAGSIEATAQEVSSIVLPSAGKLDIHIEDMVRRLSLHPAAALYRPTSLEDSLAADSLHDPPRSASYIKFDSLTNVISYYNIFNAQFLDMIKTPQGLVPRVIPARDPGNKTFDQVNINPRAERSPSYTGVAAIQFESARSSVASSVYELDLEESTESETTQGSLAAASTPRSPSQTLSPLSPTSSAHQTVRPDSAHQHAPRAAKATVDLHASRPFHIPNFPRPPPPDELGSALDDIFFAASMVVSLPHASRQAFRTAVRDLTLFRPRGPIEAVRRERYLVDGEIGLSLHSSNPQNHMAKARAHLAAALSLVGPADEDESQRHDSCAFPALPSGGRWQARVALDSAHLTAREARLAEKAGQTESAAALRRQAFETLQEVLRTLRAHCVTVEDDETLAHALIGCGRVVRKIGRIAVTEDATPSSPSLSTRRPARWSLAFTSHHSALSLPEPTTPDADRRASETALPYSSTGKSSIESDMSSTGMSSTGTSGTTSPTNPPTSPSLHSPSMPVTPTRRARGRRHASRPGHDAASQQLATEYFEEAQAVLERGLARPRGDAVEFIGGRSRLMELRPEIQGLLAGNRGGFVLLLHAQAQEAG